MQLSELAVGDHARVAGYDDNNAYTQKLMNLGLTPGTVLRVQRRAPLGDPIEIHFRGFSLAVRPAETTSLRLESISADLA